MSRLTPLVALVGAAVAGWLLCLLLVGLHAGTRAPADEEPILQLRAPEGEVGRPALEGLPLPAPERAAPVVSAGVPAAPTSPSGALDRSTDPGPSLALALAAEDLAEAFLPTPEGLFERTSELWAQEAFLACDAARLRALLPLDDELATLPEWTDLRDLIGADLPTLEDCRRALEDAGARALLAAACELDAVVAELQRAPHVRRSAELDRALELLRRRRDAADDALAARLDQVDSYRHWALLTRLYREWAR